MSFRTNLLATIDSIRAISGPSRFDIRTNALTIRTRTWSGTSIGDGTATDVDLVLPAIYPIRLVRASEVTSAAGRYELGDLIVRHITPSDGNGVGYTPAQLKPVITTNNVEVIYLIVGAHAGEYSLVECRTYRPFSYELVLRRSASTP